MALGVETELVATQLKNAGIYGAIISVLLATIGGLILYIRSQHKMAAKIYGYRLTERDTLKDALNESKNAILAQVVASNERNELTERLVQLIHTSNAQADTLNALLKMQFEFIKDDHARMNQVLGSMADSVRNLNTSSNTIETGVRTMPVLIQDLQRHIENLLPRRGRNT
jgi:hypothetical protein